ncbi:glycosyltransferase involved in cell wall biosynthesis [Motilibacter rhizosphaerae]|uniref:Glycosyltransferase involved in cell wall biosynthesis n=1 Tax=Motilibacter rhizosphaerae TaxID=598652 RepID=A0A4Q7NB76_9ACTN|nr:glycosyltransferase [Motilibacter rhizosphaerae]RZS80228.1 glycosyltransferase involved in cell wall biosynthesis [Motilibacter rhizosphaerae]
MAEAPLRVRLVLATSTGGVGAHVRALAAHLVAAGDDVCVLGPAQTETRFHFTATGASFTPVEISTSARPVSDALAVRRLRGLLEGADVVHAHGLRAGLVASLALRPGAAPLVVTWHNAVLAEGARRAVVSRMERRVAEHASVVLGVSDDLVERARTLGAADARLAAVAAPPLAGTGRSREDVRDELGAGRSPLVVAVGRLAPQKSFGTLLGAARIWRDRLDRPLTVIAGEGPLRGRLQRQIKDDGLAVRLLGHRDDVPDLLAAADVAVLPSQWEGRPLVVEEALRSGTPLVATAVGGVPAMVGDAGLLVPPGDQGALAAAVISLLDDAGLRSRLRTEGQLRAAGFPSEADTAAAARRLYTELRGTRPDGAGIR